jgi:hypothetical protein
VAPPKLTLGTDLKTKFVTMTVLTVAAFVYIILTKLTLGTDLKSKSKFVTMTVLTVAAFVYIIFANLRQNRSVIVK